MNLAENSDKLSLHPFAGCNRLLEQYQVTGGALLAYEGAVCATLIPSARSMRNFSTAVAFVPVEVLETYLDDLLDLGVNDESLFIKKSRPTVWGISIVAVLVCAMVGALSVWHGDLAAALMPALLAVTFLAGIGTTLYFLPRTKVIRRFGFATVVSHEIGNRRGQDKTKIGNFATRFLMGDMWRLNDYSTSRSLPPQPARVGVRYFH